MTDEIIVDSSLTIPISEVELTAVRAQGAGGQNVNKVATAIHLRFDIRNSTHLPDKIKQRLLALSDHRINRSGVVIIKSQQYRTQRRNKRAAIDRLTELIESVLPDPKPRKKRRPSQQAIRKRLEAKRKRAGTKQSRNKPSLNE